MGVNITTIAYLRVLIIEIRSTIIWMVVEAQGFDKGKILNRDSKWWLYLENTVILVFFSSLRPKCWVGSKAMLIFRTYLVDGFNPSEKYDSIIWRSLLGSKSCRFCGIPFVKL